MEKFSIKNELPDPFLMSNGKNVSSISDWEKQKESIKAILFQYEYGHMPPPPGNISSEVTKRIELVFNNFGIQKNVKLSFGPEKKLFMNVELTYPVGNGPFPTILINRRSSEKSRILPKNLEASVKAGYLVAEYNASDLQADETDTLGPAKNIYQEYDWGTIAVWAWGGMRVIDYLVTLPIIDKNKILVTGHSRGGKTALLTGAIDERVAITVPNATGGGGFQCWRFPIWPQDKPGVYQHESIEIMSRARTYWFHHGLRPFAGKENCLPFDQHFLSVLVAPRPLCIVESMDDKCGTPICVQRTYQATKIVYKWLGYPENLGLYFRQKGGHAQGPEDWSALLEFATKGFSGNLLKLNSNYNLLPYPDALPGFNWQAPSKII